MYTQFLFFFIIILFPSGAFTFIVLPNDDGMSSAMCSRRREEFRAKNILMMRLLLPLSDQ